MKKLFAVLPFALALGCTTRVVLGFEDGASSTGTTATGTAPSTGSGTAGSTGSGAGGVTRGSNSGGNSVNGTTGGESGIDAGADAGPDAGPDAGIPDSGAGLCGLVSDLMSSVTYPLGTISLTLASADINGDGLLDLIEAAVYFSPGDGGFNVLFGLADGGLSAPSFYPIDYGTLAVGDINGDGPADVVVSNAVDRTVGITIFLNDGRGSLIEQPFLPTPDFDSAFNLAIGDVNGDGHADLVVAGPGDQSGFVAVLFRLPDGGFSAPAWVPGIEPAFSGGLLAADLNGDGLADLVTNTLDQLHLAVLLSQSDGGFETTLYDIPALGRILLLLRPGGLPDLVLGETGFVDGSLWSVVGVGVMANLGGGHFSEPRTYTISGGFDVAIGDFNGDCIPDIASPALSEEVCQAGWFVSVLFGDADGGFGQPVNLSAPGQGPSSIAVLGPVGNPTAIAVGDSCGGGVTVYGDASRR